MDYEQLKEREDAKRLWEEQEEHRSPFPLKAKGGGGGEEGSMFNRGGLKYSVEKHLNELNIAQQALTEEQQLWLEHEFEIIKRLNQEQGYYDA